MSKGISEALLRSFLFHNVGTQCLNEEFQGERQQRKGGSGKLTEGSLQSWKLTHILTEWSVRTAFSLKEENLYPLL
jgi:hypothetical protein